MMRHTARLSVLTPFDGAALLAFLSARAVPGVEEVTANGYRRSLALAHGPAVLDLVVRTDHVEAAFTLGDTRDVEAAVDACRRLLDLDRDPRPVAAHLGDDPLLGSLVRAAPGRRVPGHPDGCELAVRAVLGQQVSVKAATRLAGRLVARLGVPLPRAVGSVTHLFPSPGAIAALDAGELPMPRSRGRTLVRLAAELASGRLALDHGVDPQAARAQLLALPGIGPWTAGYVAMRALRDPDAFIPGDVGVRRGLVSLGCSSSELAEVSARWRPYRAYAVQYLWAVAA